MNHNIARHTAHAFRINFEDLLSESTANHLPVGLADLLIKVRTFATEAGELDLNRPDSNTAFYQADMGRVWFHAQRALADTRIVGSKTTAARDDSAQAFSDRNRRNDVIWHLTWIAAICKNASLDD